MSETEIAMTNSAIEWRDDNTEEQIYHFYVGLVTEGSIGARGQYHPARNGNVDRPTIIIEINEPSVIAHEALHATIDFFRSLGMSFDLIFDEEDGTSGEEMFCHYHGHFVDLITDAINGILENQK